MSQLVWFITGTSTGFGAILTNLALQRGDRVIATARNLEKIKHLESPNCKILQLDVTDSFETIQAVAQQAIDIWGYVDVVVNNAGIGSGGITEEMGAAGYAKEFDVNFFATINVTVAFLPHMRERKSGTIVLMGSRHAWKSQFPLIGVYAASKAALHAWGESLSSELKPFGVRVLITQPGAHRTGIIGTSLSKPLNHCKIPAYDDMRQGAIKRYNAQDGKQPSDPVKAMTAIIDVVRGEGPAKGKDWPLWLVLGKDAEADLRENCEVRLKNLDEWKDVTRGVAVDDDHFVLI